MPTTAPAQDPNIASDIDATDLTLNAGKGGLGLGAPSFTGSPAPGTDIDPFKADQDKQSGIISELTRLRGESNIANEGQAQNVANTERYSASKLHEAWNAEAATSRDIPSWNETKQKEKFATDPVKAFGSVGSVFAMVAAAFTHRPMINALQGSAAAMDATREGDEKAYKDAYTAWKDNTELALKRHDMMRQEFEDAAKVGQTDIAAAKQQQLAIALKYDDKRRIFLLQNGLDEEYLKLEEMSNKVAEETRKHVNSIKEDTIANMTHESMVGQINKAFEGRPKDDPQRLGLLAEADRRYLHTLQGGKTTLMEDEQWQTVIQWEKEHAKDRNGEGPTAEERQKFLQGFQARYGSILANQREALFQELEAAKDAGDTEGANRIQQKINDLKTATSTTGNQRIDQSIVNQLANYPHLTQNDLGYISPTQQTKLASTFISAQNLERIAAYARDNPESIGLIADASKRMNLDVYQSWFGSDGGATEELKNKTEADRDAAIDASAKEQGLNMTQAAKAKILSKMLTTQAFADAAAAGSRGGTIFLDRAFKEIYQQASSPEAFFGILQKRYEDSNVVASQYKMGFNERSDKQNMPFWDQGPEGFIHRADAANKGLQVRDVVAGKDGKKYKYNGGPADDKNSYVEVPPDTPVTKHGR
jgi:hypothetical protein